MEKTNEIGKCSLYKWLQFLRQKKLKLQNRNGMKEQTEIQPTD